MFFVIQNIILIIPMNKTDLPTKNNHKIMARVLYSTSAWSKYQARHKLQHKKFYNIGSITTKFDISLSQSLTTISAPRLWPKRYSFEASCSKKIHESLQTVSGWGQEPTLEWSTWKVVHSCRLQPCPQKLD